MSKNIPFCATSREYLPIAQDLLAVDYLEEGEDAVYYRDVATKSYLVPRVGTTPSNPTEPERDEVKILTIGCYPSLKKDDIRRTPYNLIERTDMRVRDSTKRTIDVEVIKAINAAVEPEHSFSFPSHRLVGIKDFLKAMGEVEAHEVLVDKIVMNPVTFNSIKDWVHPRVRFYTRAEIEENNTAIWGEFFDAKIYVSTMVPRNSVYFLPDKKYVGVMPVEHELQEEEANEPQKQRVGKVFTTRLGFHITNPYTIARILLNVKEDAPQEVIIKECSPQTLFDVIPNWQAEIRDYITGTLQQAKIQMA